MNGWGAGIIPSVVGRRERPEDWLATIVAAFRRPGLRKMLTVRRDWPDGSHDFYGFFRDRTEATAWIIRDLERLRSAAIEPRHDVVLVPERVYQDHQNTRCHASHCPRPPRPRPPTGAEFTGGLW